MTMSTWAAAAVAAVRRRARGPALRAELRVTLNFHPDFRVAGHTVRDLLGAHGTSRSQFETGTSNGGLTAHPGWPGAT